MQLRKAKNPSPGETKSAGRAVLVWVMAAVPGAVLSWLLWFSATAVGFHLLDAGKGPGVVRACAALVRVVLFPGHVLQCTSPIGTILAVTVFWGVCSMVILMGWGAYRRRSRHDGRHAPTSETPGSLPDSGADA